MSHSPFRHIDSIFWKRTPIQFTFFVTRRCNARCPFCFYLSGHDGRNDNEGELSLHEIEKVSSSMGKLLWLAFSGGEIFLRNDIVEITKIFYLQNRPSIILFPTNGLLTDVIREKIEQVLKLCPESTITVKLSLEGMEDIHDRIRGEGSFRKTLQTYDALKGLIGRFPNFELGINSVFCSMNEDGMDDLVEYVRTMDAIKTHTVSLIRGTVADSRLKDIDIEKYKKVIHSLAANLRTGKSDTYRFKGARLKAAQDIIQRDVIYKTLTHKKQIVPCYAGKLNLVLTETGDVFPCESFDMKMGNVRESSYDMKEILEGSEAQRIMQMIQDNNCYCTHECYLMTNILFNPRMYPELIREYARLLF